MPLIEVSEERAKEIFPSLGMQIIFGTGLRKKDSRPSANVSEQKAQVTAPNEISSKGE